LGREEKQKRTGRGTHKKGLTAHKDNEGRSATPKKHPGDRIFPKSKGRSRVSKKGWGRE